jgi:acyl carrier protein
MALNRDTMHLSEAKRALLEQYKRSALSHHVTRKDAIIPRTGTTAPLSFEQRQRWLLTQLTPELPLYHTSVTLRLPGPLDVPAFERSFNEMIARHASLRSYFPLVNGEPVQAFLPSCMVDLPVVDLSGVAAAEQESAAEKIASRDAQQPFDLAIAPLFRARLIRLAEDSYCLYLTLHDIIADCISLYQVFLPELRLVYEAVLGDEPSPLHPLPIQYTDYAWWQREHLTDEALLDQAQYWRGQLANLPVPATLQTDRPRPAVPTHRGALARFIVPEATTSALKAFCRQEGVTLFMLLEAAFSTLLFKLTGQDDVVVGTVSSAGRVQQEVQGIMGWFINTLALRMSLAGDPPVRELVGRARDVTLAAFARQDVPFDRVLELAHEGDGPGSQSWELPFREMLVLEPAPPRLPCGWTLTLMEDRTRTAKFDLTIVVNDLAEGLAGRCEYNTDLFDSGTVTQLVDAWQSMLASMATDPTQRISDLSCPIITVRHHSTAESATARSAPASPMQTPAAAAITPSTALHQQLVEIWEELLAVRPIGINDNFFDLGGHSLLAAQMVNRIEEVFGQRVPLVVLFNGATIALLADALMGIEQTDGQSPLLALNSDGAKRPMFFLYGEGADSGLWCVNVARDLGPEQPFYGLPRLTFDGLPSTRMLEAMAQRHLDQVRAVQPQGPYLLGGYCNGALLAYEMAHQLLAKGQAVDLLLLVEPVAPRAIHRLIHGWIGRIGHAIGLAPAQQLDWFIRAHLVKARVVAMLHTITKSGRGLGQWLRLSTWFDRLPVVIARFKTILPATADMRNDWFGRYGWAMAEYALRPQYPGRMAVLWTSQEAVDEPGAPSIASRKSLWHNSVEADQIEIHLVPGTRKSCRTEHVHELAAHWDKCLAQADLLAARPSILAPYLP